ncbi:enolase C-terminal domain-like protein [Actinopolymorpha pittospori]|uniref:glucarate dehydratase n=1 Tax=Actinopolymorpha pittospori TaxID=648752 RepID=A0A927RDC9_9ACTN|nr:enolase C-terminal domain-like protein [Actinopolymorpha pittospori]MBE1612257.1 L-alanine-DL-glutamate epimerase-like enolase superfamily enzyme [Actinopolymorpha pittospori]
MTIVESATLTEFEFDVPGSGRALRKFAVQLRTDDGHEGSYVALWSAPPLAVPQTLAGLRMVVGQDYRDRERLWDAVNRAHAKHDRIGYGAVDIALWDIAGKAAGAPIWALLGRHRERLPAYVSTVGGTKGRGSLGSPAAYADYAEYCVRLGVRAYKFHGFGTGLVKDEIDVMCAVGERLAGRADVMTDPGKGLPTLADALKLGRVCDEVGAYWWEDPLRGDAPTAHKILRERVKTPLLITEFVRGLELRMSLALTGGTDMLRADPELDMGITGVIKTARAAESLGIDVEVHAAGPAQRHCMAAIRNTNYYELGLLDPELGNPVMPPVYGDGYTEDLGAVGVDGCVSVPSGPGLGVSYDWEWIKGHAVATHEIAR